MARIRSCFPGQWTDEDFVECSPLARLLVIGLRNEADDQGVFEWKPRALKMRLLPADDINVGDLLNELADHRQVMPYEVDGKAYGAIRNFVLWQRPKKPKAIHPITPEVREWVGMNKRSTPAGSTPVDDQGGNSTEPDGDEGAAPSELVPDQSGTEAPSTAASSEPVPHQSPTDTEPVRISPFRGRREEVGGRREEDLGSGVDESSAGGNAGASGSDPTAAAIVQNFGSEAVDAVFVLVEKGVENWFDVTRHERSPRDARIIRDWLASTESAGLAAPDALGLIGEVVDFQLKRLSEKPRQSAPFSLGMLQKDIDRAIDKASRKPPQVADGPKATPEDRAPAPYDKRFTMVQWASWIKPCTVTVADRRAVIVAPAALTADRLRQHHDHDLRECLGVDEIDVQVAPRVKPGKGGGASAAIIPHPATVAEVSK